MAAEAKQPGRMSEYTDAGEVPSNVNVLVLWGDFVRPKAQSYQYFLEAKARKAAAEFGAVKIL